MRINLNAAHAQAGQVRAQANNLRSARMPLSSYQSSLNQNWRGEEVVLINQAIQDLQTRLTAAASELDSISADIIAAAEAIRRAEELADAQAALAGAASALTRARQDLQQAQRQHDANPSPASQAAVNAARTRVNNATNTHNNAAAKVRALT